MINLLTYKKPKFDAIYRNALSKIDRLVSRIAPRLNCFSISRGKKAVSYPNFNLNGARLFKQNACDNAG